MSDTGVQVGGRHQSGAIRSEGEVAECDTSA